MKKIFTLLACAALALGASAAETVLQTVVCPASKNNAEGTADLGYYFKKGWGTKPFDLDFKVDGEIKGMDGKYFTDALVGDQLRFTYTIDTEKTDESNVAQIQLAAKLGEDWLWVQMFDAVDLPVATTYPAVWTYTIGESQTTYGYYKDEADDVYQSAEEELAALKQSGIVVKGQLFYLKQIQLVRPDGAGSDGIQDVAIDLNAPAEYFNLQGIRVAEPVQGQLYIVRQGAKTAKIVK